MSDSWTNIVTHVMRTLPAGVEPRLTILKSLDEALPPNHAMSKSVKDARFGLEHHLTQLRELNLGGNGTGAA